MTRYTVFRELWNPTGVTRKEIEASLGLSRPTVDKAIAELARRGFITPMGTRSVRGGRPATVFRLDGGIRSVVGIDLELPQLTFVLSDLWGDPLHQRTLSVADSLADPVPLLGHVVEELAGWLNTLGVPWRQVAGIGIALPAFVNDGVASFLGATVPSWRGVAVQNILESEIPAPVHVHHDTHLMALAEARALGWSGSVLLYVALRPGLNGEVRFGASLLVDGRAYRGAHGHGGSLYRAFVAKEEMEGCSAEERVDLLVDRALGFLVLAVTLGDPERVVFHAGMLGEDAEAFLAGCQRRLREMLAGEFPNQHKMTLAVEHGPSAALGAAIAVVQHLRDNPEALFAEEGGDTGNNAHTAGPQSSRGRTANQHRR
jgi:hypothetical protein